MTIPVAVDAPAKRPHPFLFAILVIPFGALGGFVGVTLAHLCTLPEHGLTVQDGAMLIAAGMFPHVWKFLWAPIADTTLTRKRWYLISCALCAIGVFALGAIPLSKDNLLTLQIVNFVANLACTFLGMSVEGLMVHATPADKRGTAGGWFQAGNLGGYGLGGGAGLWMATHLPSAEQPLAWISGAVVAVAFLACAAVLPWVPEAPTEARGASVMGSVRHVAIEVWSTIRSPGGFLCAVLCLIPINTGAASGVLVQAEVAAKWDAGEKIVSVVNGLLSGPFSAVGCLVAGYVCNRLGSRKVYAGVAVVMAAISASMALSPMTPTAYVAFLLAYNFVLGMSYAAFTGFVLDAIGKTAAATKYNTFASLSNAPITYMGLILAWSHGKWGEKGMLLTEAGVAVIALMVLGAVAAVVMPRNRPESAVRE